MTSQDPIYTLTAPHQFKQEIRKSIFLAYAVPVRSEEQVEIGLQRLKSSEATHNCWAYRMGQKYRVEDDGEPSGTAGRPILQVIERQNFDEVLVLVVRWFGGIKLGAGGLIRAYAGTAAECLRQAPSELYIPRQKLCVICSFSDHMLLLNRIVDYGAELLKEEFHAMDVELRISVPSDQMEALRERMMDLTRGQILIEVID